MKMSKMLIFFLFSFFSFCGFSQDASVLLGRLEQFIPARADELFEAKKLVYMKYDGKEEGQKIDFRSSLYTRIGKALPLKNPLFSMDVVYLIKKENSKKEKNISRILCSISSLKGLQYYSSSRRKMRVLYEDSYAVKRERISDGTFKYTKVEDPINDKIDGFSVYVCHEDLTFGKNIYQYSYFEDGLGVGVLVSNVDPLYYSIFKALDAQAMNSYLVVYDMEDYLLVYASTRAKFKKIIGLETKIKNSFMSRLDAMFQWFIKKYNE